MQDVRDIQIPIDPDQSDGPFLVGKALILALKDREGIAEIDEIDEDAVTWLAECYMVYFQLTEDGFTPKVCREATEDDLRRFRVPSWIQSGDVPACCGKPMVFVGQLDDNILCTEPPVGAKYWWHDAASFYVFTCDQCLSVKAVGQQY